MSSEAISGIILLIIGIIMILAAIILMITYKNSFWNQPWYIWVMLLLGIALVIVGIVLIVKSKKRSASQVNLNSSFQKEIIE